MDDFLDNTGRLPADEEGFVWIVRSNATLLSMSDKKRYVNYVAYFSGM
jgi:hypothetical protein